MLPILKARLLDHSALAALDEGDQIGDIFERILWAFQLFHLFDGRGGVQLGRQQQPVGLL